MSEVKAFRLDAVDKVTGRAKYGADYYDPHMLYAKVCWAPAPHCRINKIDISEAKAIPGVYGIVTRKDITGPNLTGVFTVFDRPVLVGEGEECKFVQDAIALVAADTEEIAMEAVRKIHVDYTELHGVHTAEQALEEHCEPCVERSVQRGDMAKGWAQAAVTVEEDYYIPLGEHSYIEPEGGYACIDESGVIKVYCGTQDQTMNQRSICRALDYPFSKVHYHVPYVGGGFGGKHLLTVQPYLVLLCAVLQRSVHLTWTREESIAFSCKKQGTFGRIKLGLDKDGKICALEGHIDGAGGAYLANSGDNCNGVIAGMAGPYLAPNVNLTGSMYYTTSPEQGAFRSVGAMDGCTVFETLLTEAADKLGMDQLEVRKRNFLRTKDEVEHCSEPCFIRMNSPRWPIDELMDMCLKEAGKLPPPKPGKHYGRGYSAAKAAYATRNTDWHSGSPVQMHMFMDGSITVHTGFEELGQGVTGVATRICAQAMDTDEDKITVLRSDTHVTPPAGALGFSQATVSVGNSIIRAANLMKETLCKKAQTYLETDEQLTFKGYAFYDKNGKCVLDWEEFGKYIFAQVDYLSIVARDRGDKETAIEYGVTPIACVCDVEVDDETGEVKILQIIHAHDSGKVVHEPSARGQVLGATVMSQGCYLMEEFKMRDGYPETPSLAQYLIPTAMDIPEKNTALFLEGNGADDCPFGAKGLGEHPMYTTGAAISGAIYDAIKKPMLHLPVTPEKILKAMNKF